MIVFCFFSFASAAAVYLSMVAPTVRLWSLFIVCVRYVSVDPAEVEAFRHVCVCDLLVSPTYSLWRPAGCQNLP